MNAVPRMMSFIVAAKSVRRFLIGDLLNASGCIPVERPQDVKQEKATGKLTKLQDGRLSGKKT